MPLSRRALEALDRSPARPSRILFADERGERIDLYNFRRRGPNELGAWLISDPADEPIEKIVGSTTIAVTAAMTATTKNAEVARQFVPVPLVGQVMNVEVPRRAAVQAAPARPRERILPTRLPRRTP